MIKDSVKLPSDLPKTAIIGATGFLGSRFFNAYREKYPDCVGTARAKDILGLGYLDLSAPDISGLMLRKKGHSDALIIAAMPKIDQCEEEKELTRRVNVDGTLELLRQLKREGIKPIFFSSDYVFDGASGGYSDDSPTRPITEYGRQKAEVERKIPGICGRDHLIVRIGKVFSLTRGDNSLFDEMARLLSSGGEVKAAFDQVFNPILASDVVNIVSRLQARKLTGVVNVCSKESWSRYDMAAAVARAMDVDSGRVKRVSLDEIAFKAKRLKNTSMSPLRLMGEGLADLAPIDECIRTVAANWTVK